MAYNASVPADNLYVKDIPGAIREKGKELAAITEGYPPIVNADKVDGYDTSLEPAAHVILITDENGKLPTGALDFGSNVLAGDGLEIVSEDPEVDSVTIAMETPLTCTLETTNEFPEGGGHTHELSFTFPEGETSNAFAFYENFAGHTLAATDISTYTLVKTFSITIPSAGVYSFGCGYNVVAWGGAEEIYDTVKITMDATMVIGTNAGAYVEEKARTRTITGYTEQENPIYAYEDVGAKAAGLNGKMVYFSSAGEKLLKVYMRGVQNFQISNFCVGVIGAAT